jgi:hypothetical protein
VTNGIENDEFQSFALVVGAGAGSPALFRMGDTVVSQLSSPADVDTGLFFGLAKSTVRLKMDSPDGIGAIVKLSILGGGEVEEFVVPAGGKGATKKIKLPSTGYYRLDVTSLDGAVGGLTLSTELVKAPKSGKQVKKQEAKPEPPSKTIAFPVLAEAGAVLTGKITGNKAFSGNLELSVFAPDGGLYSGAAFGTTSPNSIELPAMQLYQPGVYAVRIEGFKKASDVVNVDLKVTQPQLPSQVVQID